MNIGQKRIFSLNETRHLLSAGYVMKGNRPDVYLARAELSISRPQLDELLPTRASGLAAIKHQNHTRPTAHISQVERLAVLALQAKIWGDPQSRRNHPGRSRSWRRQRGYR